MKEVKQTRKLKQWVLATALISGFFAMISHPVVGQVFDPGTSAGPADTSVTTPTDSSPPIDELNAQIIAKKKRIEELQQQASTLQQSIDSASSQVNDLKSQVTQIDSQIAESNFHISIKKEEIASLELEMSAIQQSIGQKTSEMDAQKKNLANAIKQLDENTRTSTLALVLTHDTLSDFYSQAQAVAALGNSLQDSISSLTELKNELQGKHDQLATTRDEYKQSRLQLEVQKQSIEDQRGLKTQLLDTAGQNKDTYQNLLEQSAKEEQSANATISALEKQLQDRLSNGKGQTDQPIFSSRGFIWPLANKGITTYFHDSTYPFRRLIGEHTGLDVRAAQGTPVKAVADGVVSVVHDQGFYTNSAGQKTRSALNFVGLVHGSGLSSRYLHLSAVYVHTDQFVRQGEVIGLSGGLPGTAGAGGITTGAHLHFEVRVDGIPDDPLKYLP